MPTKSLAFRLVGFAVLWSIIAIVVAGVILTSIFRQTAQSSLDQRLAYIADSFDAPLIDAIEAGPDEEFARPSLEIGYSQLLSGWYWLIEDDTGKILYASQSSTGVILKLPPFNGIAAGSGRFYEIVGPQRNKLRVFDRKIDIEGQKLRVAITANLSELESNVARFNQLTLITLSALGIGLSLAIYGLIRFGLRPLKQISEKLVSVRAGNEQRLSGNFPTEIEPLARELNSLIDQNEKIVERARTHVGNLAHALKTPLSVMRNEIVDDGSDRAQLFTQQTNMMQQQIDHHLSRARMAAQRSAISKPFNLSQTAKRLTDVIQKIYGRNGIEVILQCDDDIIFRGESNDIEEILGNLIDNACKWAERSVNVTIERRESDNDVRRRISITVEDDGSGLTDLEITAALERGKRLDESVQGTGLGLSIVKELVELYSGTLDLAKSPMGGLQVDVTLISEA